MYLLELTKNIYLNRKDRNTEINNIPRNINLIRVNKTRSMVTKRHKGTQTHTKKYIIKVA